MISNIWSISILFGFLGMHVSVWFRGTARHTPKSNHWIFLTHSIFMPSSSAAPPASMSATTTKKSIFSKNLVFWRLYHDFKHFINFDFVWLLRRAGERLVPRILQNRITEYLEMRMSKALSTWIFHFFTKNSCVSFDLRVTRPWFDAHCIPWIQEYL